MTSRTYPSFLIYKDAAGNFRWKLQAANHKIIADSGEGYNNLADCEHAIDLVKLAAGYDIWETNIVTQGRR